MADANPSLKNDMFKQPINVNARPEISKKVNKNPHNDRSDIRKADGTHVRKVTCPVCNTRRGYNILEPDPGCVQCELNQEIAKAKEEQLKRLEEEVLKAEKEAEEFEKKEKELKDRLAKARNTKK